MGGKKKQTVGYKYFLGMHASLCLGPIDKITRIKYGDKVAWEGENAGGQLQINAPELFGGESGEGGIQGRVDVLMGEPTQGRNDYLLARLGTLISAFRGVVTLVFRQVYWGTSPYIKAISVTAQRIFVRQDGAAQWYPEKAKINSGGAPEQLFLDFSAAAWRYKVEPVGAGPSIYASVTFDDSGWAVGQAPFGDRPHPSWDYAPAPNTVIPVNHEVWLRRTVSLPQIGGLVAKMFADNYPTLWINGYELANDGPITEDPFIFASIPVEILNPTGNVIAYRVRDVVTPIVGNSIQADLRLYKPEAVVLQDDMNPAHIIRECVTNSDGGMGYADADVDAASFTAAADTLHAEGFGLSLLWEQQGSIEEFVGDVQTHIDGRIYVHPRTGLWTLKLIREDYDIGELPTLGPQQVLRVEDYARPQFGELANSVTVKYWDAATQTGAALSVDDPALIQMQGKVSGVTFDYPGVTNADLAARLAQRDLRTVSSQLLSATIYCNRSAALLLPGDPFLFNWPQLHADPIVCRVGKIELGDGTSGEVKISIVEDVFGLATAGIAQAPGSGWSDPSAGGIGPTTALALEMPYYEMVQRYGEGRTSALLAETPEVGLLLLTGRRPTGAINATGYVAGEEMRERVDFSPSGSLASAVAHADTLLDISWLNDTLPATGSHIQVGTELMRFDGLDSDGLSLVGRGVLDTVPAAHAYGTACWGWDAFAVTDEVERAEGETVSSQLVPRGTSAVGPYSATVDVEFNARAYRPYPPGKLRINGAAYPDAMVGVLSVGWAHRDRLLQTATLVDTESASIGPEPGTTYNLRIYGDGDALVKSEVVSGTSYTFNAELIDGDPRWNNVAVALHLDGADGSTTFTDLKGHTVTATGSAAISTDHFKFGGASLELGAASFLEIPYTADLEFGSTWTISYWVYGNSVGLGNMSRGQYQTFGYTTAWSGLQFSIRGTIVYFGGTSNANESKIALGASWASWFTAGRMNHVEVVRDGSTGYLFINGALAGTVNSISIASVANRSIFIGKWDYNVAPEYAPGWYDDIQMTIGVARHTSSFTPPDAAFGGAGSGVNTQLRIELESVRDGYTSQQRHNFAFERAGWGYNYGNFYGGV